MKSKKHFHQRPAEDLGPLITIAQAAERLRRKPMTVRRLIHRGKLRAVLVGYQVMVVERSVEEFLRPLPYKPQRPTPACAGWNDKLRAELQQAQESQA